MRSLLTIAAAAVVGFIVASTSILIFWISGFEEADCSGESCALELAAVLNAAILVGLLVAAVAGFVTYVLHRRRSTKTFKP